MENVLRNDEIGCEVPVEVLEPKAPAPPFDPFVLLVVALVAAVVFLLVWFVIEAR